MRKITVCILLLLCISIIAHVNASATDEIVSAKVDIPAGTEITKENIDILFERGITTNPVIYEAGIPVENAQDILIGSIVINDIEAGTYVNRNDFHGLQPESKQNKLNINGVTVFIAAMAMAGIIWVTCELYIECTTPELKALKTLNRDYRTTVKMLNVQLPSQLWRCSSKSEFDRWDNVAMGRMERILDKYETFVIALPHNMNVLYREYKDYSVQATALYQHMNGIFLRHKQRKFQNRIEAPPNNIVMRVRVTYTSPQGRNSYAKTYEMQYKDVLTYLRTFPTAENTYLPDAFIRPNNKFVDCAGTYVLYNQQDNKYYVGQATSLQRRLHQHFTGSGNGDVYADYRMNKPFTIYIFPLVGSQFTTLNDQERHYIAKYRAFETGYNKTHGNR